MANTSQSQKLPSDDALIQLVIFRAADEEFAMPIEMVREIIKKSIITPIPNSPKFINGIINVRGKIVLTIDMKVYFALSQEKGIEEKHVVVTKQQNNLFGLLVDEVVEVLRVQKKEIQTPPNLLSKIQHENVLGVLTHDNRLIILLNVSKMLMQKEILELADKNKDMNINVDHEKDSSYEENMDY